MSKSHPILFSGPMVRAILDGRKTQTRRVVKGINHDLFDEFLGADPSGFWGFDSNNSPVLCVHSPYGEVGDLLWVRETWAVVPQVTDNGPKHKAKGDGTGATWRASWDGNPSGFKWKPSIHMPRWASRITLEITGLRVERLQKISRKDAIAEGIFLNANDWWDAGNGLVGQSSPQAAFRELWASINGAESWIANPWVWVVEFKVV